MRIGFLTRGHGFGHAARDLRLIREIRRQRPDAVVDVMSSGSGHRYYRSRGVDCADLGIADERDTAPAASWAVWRRLARGLDTWDLLVADEVFAAIPFGHYVLDRPVVALTDWFFRDFGRADHDRVFDHAAEVIVLDFPESHPVPPRTAAPVHYAGPVVDGFGRERREARAALGAGPEDLVAVLTVGGMPLRPEAVRMTNAVLDAWSSRTASDRLYILADRADRPQPPGVTWTGVCATPEQYYAAADVVLADAMGFTACELVANGGRVLALVDAATVGDFPASFRHRLVHMAGQGWITPLNAACGPAKLWNAIVGGREDGNAAADPAERPAMPSADVAELARRVLSHERPGHD